MKGLLWFDPGPGTLEAKVERAAQRYFKKTGQWPTVCETHPVTVALCAAAKMTLSNGREVKIETTRLIQPNHYLVGVEL